MNEIKQNSGWLEIDPKEKTDSVRHQVSSKSLINQWDVIGASVRGKKHAHFGEWRDDSYTIASAGQCTILTVADGAGSAPLSRIGSRIAARVVKATLIKSLSKLMTDMENSGDYQTNGLINFVSNCLKNAFIKAINAVIRESDKRQCPASHMATTLLTVVHIQYQGDDVFFWANVGDCVFAVFPTSNTCDILCDEDHGSSGGETRFITSSGIKESIDSRIHHISFNSPVNSFVLMTDGVADDLYPLKDRLCDLIEGGVVGKGYMLNEKKQPLKGIRHYLKNDKNDSKRITEWLKYDKLGSPYDDRTLIVALKNN